MCLPPRQDHTELIKLKYLYNNFFYFSLVEVVFILEKLQFFFVIQFFYAFDGFSIRDWVEVILGRFEREWSDLKI